MALISASLLPRMRSRLRLAARAISAVRTAPRELARSDWLCCQSFSAPPPASNRSCCRFSAASVSFIWARAVLTWDRAVTRSFWPWTNSEASTASSGSPAWTMSPALAKIRVTRPE